MVTVILAGFGGIYSLAQSVATVNQKLDRNCRILVTLDQDIRLHALSDRDIVRRVHADGFAQFPNVSC